MDMASNSLFGQILTLELVSKDRDFFFSCVGTKAPQQRKCRGDRDLNLFPMTL